MDAHGAHTGPLHTAKPVSPLCPALPAPSKARGVFGGANLELTPPLASRAGLIINDLFLIGLSCPLQGCSGIFGTEVSPSLEIFKPCLDKVLCSLLWVTLLLQGVGLGDPQRSLPTLTML